MEALSIKRNIAWNSAGSLMYSGCQWIMTVAVVRLSDGYDAAGILALAMALSNIFAPIALYRIRPYQVSDVKQEISSQEYVAFRLITMGLGFVLTLIYMFITCDTRAFLAIVLYIIFRSIEVFIDVLHGIDQQHMRMDFCGKSLCMRSILFLTAFCLCLYAHLSLEFAILGMIVSNLPILIYDLAKASKLDRVRPRIDKAQTTYLLLRCLPLVIASVACFMIVTVARQYVALSLGDATLGVYASICTPLVIIQAIAGYVFAPLLGIFAQHLEQEDIKAFFVLVRKVCLIIMVSFAAASIGLAVAGPWFFGTVFGPQILAHLDLLYPALLSMALAAFVTFVNDLIIAMRKLKTTMVVNLVAFVVSVPLSVLLTNALGANGASFSISLAYAVIVLAQFAVIFKSFTQPKEG